MSFAAISRFFLGASLLSVVFVASSLFFPFITPKVALFRLLVELALTFFLLDIMASPAYYKSLLRNVWRSPLVWAVTAFVSAFIVAGALGVNPHVSWWSDFERGEGGWLLLHLYVFFMLLVILVRSEKLWQRLFFIALAAVFLSSGYGIGQALRLPGFVSDIDLGRFSGSFGNPAYFAGYVLFAFFFLGSLWLQKSRPFTEHLGFGGLFLALLIALLASGTRGAFLGFCAGLSAFVFFALLFWRGKWRRWGITAFVVLFAAISLLFYFHNEKFVKNLPYSRVFDFTLSDGAVQARFWTWGSAWEGFKDRPFLGWGPENFLAVFDKHFDPRHFLGRGVPAETWFDRAHSVVFDYLAETGIIGFLSYASMFFVFYWLFFRDLRLESRQKRGPPDQKRFYLSRALLAGMPVAYLVNGLVFFDVFPVYISLFFFLAYTAFVFGARQAQGGAAVGVSSDAERPPKKLSKEYFSSGWSRKRFFGKIVLFAAVAAVLAGMIYGTLRTYYGAFVIRSSFTDLTGTVSIEKFKEIFRRMFIAGSPVGDTETLLRLVSSVDQGIKEGLSAGTVEELIGFSEIYSRLALASRGGGYADSRLIWALSETYKDAGEIYGRADYLSRAEELYRIGLAFAPKRPEFLFGLFDLYRREGRNEDAKALGEKIVRYWPFEDGARSYLDGAP